MIAKTEEVCALLLLGLPLGLRVGADGTNHRYEEGDHVPLPVCQQERLQFFHLLRQTQKQKDGVIQKFFREQIASGRKARGSREQWEGSQEARAARRARGRRKQGVASRGKASGRARGSREQREGSREARATGGASRSDEQRDRERQRQRVRHISFFLLIYGWICFILLMNNDSVFLLYLKDLLFSLKDSHNQAGIVYNGGLVPLLKLLDSKNGCLQHNAAFALYGIAENEDNVSDFIKVGGVQKLQDSEFVNQATKDCVAKTIKRLEEKINGRVLKHLLYLMRVGEKAVQRLIALALAHLCSPEDQRTIFIDDDGIVSVQQP
ncbi:unnamed protein product [Musa hybrid cultivar]